MPLGSSSAAPVISPGPSTRHKRGLLGPTTALGATEGSLLSKQMLPTQLKLRSGDTTSLESTWYSATRACFDQMMIKAANLETLRQLVTWMYVLARHS